MSSHNLIVVHCGDNWSFAGPINDGAGNGLNLQNATVTWKLDSLDGSKNYLSLQATITQQNPGLVAYGPNATQTSGLSPGTYYDYLVVVLQDGSTFTVLEGLINAMPQAK